MRWQKKRLRNPEYLRPFRRQSVLFRRGEPGVRQGIVGEHQVRPYLFNTCWKAIQYETWRGVLGSKAPGNCSQPNRRAAVHGEGMDEIQDCGTYFPHIILLSNPRQIPPDTINFYNEVNEFLKGASIGPQKRRPGGRLVVMLLSR